MYFCSFFEDTRYHTSYQIIRTSRQQVESTAFCVLRTPVRGVHDTWCEYVPRLCSVGYTQTIPGVFTPSITLRRTSVSSVGYSYPYPELLEVLYDIHTRTRNLWKFCTPVPQLPGVQVYHFYNSYECCTPVPQYPELPGVL